MLNTADIVTVLDMLDLDSQLSDEHGTNWESIANSKRRIAVEGWLSTRVGTKLGIPLDRHRTRREATALILNPSGSNNNMKALLSGRSNSVPANSIFAASNALYIQLDRRFRGIYVGMLEAGGSNTNSLAINSLTYWNGSQWAGFNSFVDGTRLTITGPSLAGGGRISWTVPDDMEQRLIGTGTEWLYSVKMAMGAVPNAGTVYQIVPILRSKLTVPAAYYALSLMYGDAVASERGPWKDKRDYFYERAGAELEAALPLIQDEFDLDRSGAVAPVEINSLPDTSRFDGITLERG